MLGRGVAEALEAEDAPLLAPEVVAIAREADLFVLNLECCISARGERWPEPRKPFFFRAPPVAAERLAGFGVDCVSLANNHVLDFGEIALADTLAHLDAVGVAWVGAGPAVEEARRPRVLRAGGERIAVLAFSDHPAVYAARPDRPGIAYADDVSDWVSDAVAAAPDPVLVLAHWGPNMTEAPIASVRSAAAALCDAGAAFVAGTSAHVVHGARGRVAYDLGDFVDDYAVHPRLRNDLGLLFLLGLDGGVPVALQAVPLKLEFCFTRLAEGEDAEWIAARFTAACSALGTRVERRGGRLWIDLT